MADGKQVGLLRQGVSVWNEWRGANPETAIDLTGAFLNGADLISANLSGARLDHAGLKGAHLDDADLVAAYLIRANLNGAHLVRANLTRADFGQADLSVADLSRTVLRATTLVGADLHCANMSEAKLNRADLNGAILHDAILRQANLNGADLSWTNLRKANLTGAALTEAQLDNADLSEAILHNAYLSDVIIRGANLFMADFTEAIMALSVFGEVDLSTVKGLESVRHRGPSVVAIDTIYRSKGEIPDVFLRGAGVPNDMIAFVHSLQRKAIEFYSCFISYCSKDDDLAKRLHADLQREGVRCWFAPEDLKIGDRFPDKINEAIRAYDELLLLLSGNSINSAWVKKEVRTALDKEKRQNRTVLFPIRLDDAFMDTTEDWADEIRRTRHVGDFRQWRDHDCYQQAFERLLRDLKTE